MMIDRVRYEFTFVDRCHIQLGKAKRVSSTSQNIYSSSDLHLVRTTDHSLSVYIHNM